MKSIIVAIALGAGLVAASPRIHAHHAHQHHQRAPAPVAQQGGPAATVTVYELDGKQVSQAQVEQGLQNGTLVMAEGGGIQSASSPVPATWTAAPAAYSSATSTSAVSVSIQAIAPSSYSPPNVPPPAPASPQPNQQSPAPQPPANAGSSQQAPPPSSGSGSSFSPKLQGIETDFPDGTIDCHTFPSDYGAVHLDWLNLGGWSGIQKPGSNSGGGYANIETVPGGSCPDGNYCSEGSFCSYACPAGYQKSQWPSIQGATGQSVGGIQCLNGKLHLTNKAMSSKLCMTGATQVPISVQNKMQNNSAVCRTDYPGTEGETIPLDAQPGTTLNLTCPAADNYFNWQGAHTSAQYYVNPAGVSVQDACQWGNPAKPWGNFAPVNLGVGFSSGSAWLSIFQNKPTTNQQLDFCVEIVGDNGGHDNLSGRCKYHNGQYCSESGCSSDGSGCTVSASHGTVTFVFSSA